jgi:cysteine desulfurase
MKLDVDRSRGSMRFSFGRFNTEAEVDKALEILPSVISKLRSLSSAPTAREPAGV